MERNKLFECVKKQIESNGEWQKFNNDFKKILERNNYEIFKLIITEIISKINSSNNKITEAIVKRIVPLSTGSIRTDGLEQIIETSRNCLKLI